MTVDQTHVWVHHITIMLKMRQWRVRRNVNEEVTVKSSDVIIKFQDKRSSVFCVGLGRSQEAAGLLGKATLTLINRPQQLTTFMLMYEKKKVAVFDIKWQGARPLVFSSL